MTDLKRILVLLHGEAAERATLAAAFMLGKTFGAHVTCLHLSVNLTAVYPGIGGEGLALSDYFQSAMQKSNQEQSGKARALFETQCKQHHVEITETAAAHHATASYLEEKGSPTAIITHEGRLSDVIIVSQDVRRDHAIYAEAVHSALFETGRPVLVMPAAIPEVLDKHITLAWDGSIESSRAMMSAMPLLSRAVSVVLTHIRNEPGKGSVEEERVLKYLQAHGVNATAAILEKGSESAGAQILDKAKANRSNLIVMGAYTHHRLRQLVVGGATQHMLDHTTIPLWMAH